VYDFGYVNITMEVLSIYKNMLKKLESFGIILYE